MSHKIICSYKSPILKSIVGLPIGVRRFPPDRVYPFDRVEIETQKELTPEQEQKLFGILSNWFLNLKKIEF